MLPGSTTTHFKFKPMNNNAKTYYDIYHNMYLTTVRILAI